MMNSRTWIFLTTALILMTSLACAVPGLSPASLPAPTADTVLLATMVAETVSAALTQTANAVPQVPTSTPEPTVAETPTPEVTGAGSALAKQEDGSTLFNDQLAGYEALIPVGWLAVRVNEQEYFDAWNLAETSDPAIQRSLTSIQGQDPQKFRLFALDTQDGHVQGGFVTNMNFLWEENDDMSLANYTDLQAAADSLANTIPDLEVLTTELATTSNDLVIGEITANWPATTADGVQVVVFQKQVYFKPQRGTLIITLSTTETLRDIALAEFDAMIEVVAINN